MWGIHRGMKIACGYCYYNDVESIKRGLPTFADKVDYIFAIDGKFSLRNGPDYSDDGSTEYLQSFKNVIIERFVGMEHDKRQKYIDLAVKNNVDVLIIIDSDEYVDSADWDLFRENLSKIINSEQNIHGVNFFTDGNITQYPRIWIRPHQIKYWNAHCLFEVNGNVIRSPKSLKPVLGITLKMDDSKRSEQYLKDTTDYQYKMIAFEKPFRKMI
jgi:hypothetical protein